MPAVTVSDITILPRITAAPGSRARTVKSITTAPQGFEGEGFLSIPIVSRAARNEDHSDESLLMETPRNRNQHCAW